jgi:hypothetical protein
MFLKENAALGTMGQPSGHAVKTSVRLAKNLCHRQHPRRLRKKQKSGWQICRQLHFFFASTPLLARQTFRFLPCCEYCTAHPKYALIATAATHQRRQCAPQSTHFFAKKRFSNPLSNQELLALSGFEKMRGSLIFVNQQALAALDFEAPLLLQCL